MANSIKKWWAPIKLIGLHVIVGSIIFIIIAAPSVGLGLLVKFLGKLGLPSFTLDVLDILEHTILLVDSILFVVYLVLTALKALHELGMDAKALESESFSDANPIKGEQ